MAEGHFYYEFREVDLGLEGWHSDTTKYRYEYDVEFDPTDRTLKIVDEKFYINNQLTSLQGDQIKVEFENYYGTKPAKDRITIEKKLIGTELDDRFVFEISDGTDTETVEVNGEGSAVFEPEFTEAGTFTYTIKERDMHYEGYQFDDTVYEVTYVIKEAGEKYEIESRAFTKNGEPFDTQNILEFTNSKEYQPVKARIDIEKIWNLTDAVAKDLVSTFEAPGSQEGVSAIIGNGTSKITYEFSKPGEYGFIIKENPSSNPNVIYDQTEKQIHFLVEESSSGLVVTPSVEKVTFNNLYQYKSTRVLIPVEKIVKGNSPDNKEFVVRIDGEDKVHLTGGQVKTYYRDYTTPGEYVIEITEKDSKYNY